MLQMIKDIPPLVTPRKIRIKFAKGGDLIYISHLDLNRTMTRAIVRARIPVKYTEGFNPRPKLVFATPLSVGCASECEYLDIKIDREMSCDDIKEKLSAQVPSGIDILDVYEPDTKFTDILYSLYEIKIKDSQISESAGDKIKRAFEQSELVITKRSKSGDKEVNILPYIKELDISGKGAEIVINTKLCVSSADFLNPEYIVSIAYDKAGLSNDNYSMSAVYSIVRKALFLADLTTNFR